MYGLAVMLSISTWTTSKTINKIEYRVLKDSLKDTFLAISIVFEGLLNGTVKVLLWSDMAVTIDAL